MENPPSNPSVANGSPESTPLERVVDSALLAAFTHQIINPLNGVVGTVDNLIDGTISQPRRRLQRLRAVRAQLAHAIELVRNLAYLSQLTTQAGRESLREVGSRSTLPQIVIQAALFYQENPRGIKIDLTDKVTQYVIPGPPALLRQVFLNLFENAVKYGDEGSLITVIPRVQSKTEQLLVEVTNKGPGFAHAERERIFERGYRGAAAREIVASGSGLGLYLCKDILSAAFDATIEAEHSSLRRSTTFRIRFNKFNIESLPNGKR